MLVAPVLSSFAQTVLWCIDILVLSHWSQPFLTFPFYIFPFGFRYSSFLKYIAKVTTLSLNTLPKFVSRYWYFACSLSSACPLFVPVWISHTHLDSSGFLKTLHSFRSLPVSDRPDTFMLFELNSTMTSLDFFSAGSSVIGLAFSWRDCQLPI